MKAFDPAAVMSYTDVQTLMGLDTPVDYGSGIEYVNGLVEAYPKAGLQIGLWLNGAEGCRDILDGKLDKNINILFRYLKKLPTKQIFLRVGYGTSQRS